MKDVHSMEYEIGLNRRKPEFDRIKNHLLDSDSCSYSDDRIILTIDYTRQGQERFSKIYAIIDPDRNHTSHLTRKRIIFKND
jgi:hypothetical protein